jgi:hypothetical protein
VILAFTDSECTTTCPLTKVSMAAPRMRTVRVRGGALFHPERIVVLRASRGYRGGPGRRILLGELGPVQLRVQAARREQLSVRAALADPAAVDHQDLVGLPDG